MGSGETIGHSLAGNPYQIGMDSNIWKIVAHDNLEDRYNVRIQVLGMWFKWQPSKCQAPSSIPSAIKNKAKQKFSYLGRSSKQTVDIV